MGYYASYSGSLKLKENIDQDDKNELYDAFEDLEYDEKTKLLCISGHSKYYEDEIETALNYIKNNVEEGSIEFTGEDDCHWRFIFKNGSFTEESGYLMYDSDFPEKNDFLGKIIDVIQDTLDNPKGEIIEGEWYDEIKGELEELMKNWHVFS